MCIRDSIKEVVRALNIPILELEGYEADDVLGTVAAQMHGQVPVYIITGDRDLLQLVDDNTRVELPARKANAGGEVYDAAGVVDYLGVRPDQVVDYKALGGDVSDNIPGVKGIGEAGTIASTGTVYNAVMDALRPLGVDDVRMPLTPERVWRAVQTAGKGA